MGEAADRQDPIVSVRREERRRGWAGRLWAAQVGREARCSRRARPLGGPSAKGKGALGRAGVVCPSLSFFLFIF